MEKKYIFISSFLVVVSVFTLVFGFSYQQARKKANTNVAVATPESQEVDNTETIKINDQTKYTLEIYNGTTDRVTKSDKTVPAEFAGKTRKELLLYINDYLENPPLNESLQGLTDFEIISFSKGNLVLRKTYQDMAKENKFFLTVIDNEVVVYYSDKKTMFQYTGIMEDLLPDTEIAKLKIGYYVATEEELFSILENYSS